MLSRISFVFGFFVAFAAIVFVSIMFDPFGTKASRVRLGETFATLSEMKMDAHLIKIEPHLVENGYYTPERFKHVDIIYLSSDGDIVFMTTEKQLIWLHPELEGLKSVWSCIGAPQSMVIAECRY